MTHPTASSTVVRLVRLICLCAPARTSSPLGAEPCAAGGPCFITGTRSGGPLGARRTLSGFPGDADAGSSDETDEDDELPGERLSPALQVALAFFLYLAVSLCGRFANDAFIYFQF